MAKLKLIIEDIPHAKEGEENIVVTVEGMDEVDIDNLTAAQELGARCLQYIVDREEVTSYEVQGK